ncbi:MAG TPA: hypothetical protein VFX48_01300 [Saprospiraceae bacterium]|nr:hypothetical protein [Saprospiraceae bacterium]
MKPIFTFIFCLLGWGLSYGQSASEALRYSLSRPGGTARSLGVGDATGALGGDFTAITINPAGIGLFRKSDFAFSVEYDRHGNESILQGSGNNSYTRNTNSGTLSNAGLVLVLNTIGSKWTPVNISMNLTKTADFKQSFYFSGRSAGTIGDRFLELALDPNGTGLQGLDPSLLDDFEAGLAYETGVIYDPGTNPNNITYINDLRLHPGYLLPKEQLLRMRGKMHQFSIGVGATYNEKLSVGGAVNIPFGSFRSVNDYREKEAQRDDIKPFRNLQFEETIETDISGVSLSMGVIYKPIQLIRLGVSWQSPGLLTLKDQFSTSLTNTYFNDRRDTTLYAGSPDGEFEYQLITPMRLTTSAALVSRFGFISADVDYVNPKHAFFDLTEESLDPGDQEYQEELNDDIDKQYKPVLQYRLGGELAFGKLRLRAGLEFLPQPYENSDKTDKSFSLGLGYRGNKYYLDFGYRRATIEQSYAPYRTGNSDFDGNGTVDAPTPLVDYKSIRQNFMVTVGFKFSSSESWGGY